MRSLLLRHRPPRVRQTEPVRFPVFRDGKVRRRVQALSGGKVCRRVRAGRHRRRSCMLTKIGAASLHFSQREHMQRRS